MTDHNHASMLPRLSPSRCGKLSLRGTQHPKTTDILFTPPLVTLLDPSFRRNLCATRHTPKQTGTLPPSPAPLFCHSFFRRQILSLRQSDPKTTFLEATAAAAAVVEQPTVGAAAAAVIVDADVRPSSGAAAVMEEPLSRRKARRPGKAPEVVVEGDLLGNTPKMIALVWSSLALNAMYLLQVCPLPSHAI